jgi:hypothetical protein
MVTAYLAADSLEIRFSTWEKIAGLLRDLRVPRTAVTGVEVVPDGLAATRGLRAPGLSLPGVVKLGTWRGRGHKTLVAVRRNQPALRIHLTGQRYDTLLIGADDASALAQSLR